MSGIRLFLPKLGIELMLGKTKHWRCNECGRVRPIPPNVRPSQLIDACCERDSKPGFYYRTEGA